MIAFAHSPGPTENLKIWVMDVDGENRHRLTAAAAPEIEENVPRWSPDGRRIVFTSNRRDGRFEIWLVEDGGNLRVLTSAYFDESLQAAVEQKVPAWSRDGARVAFWSGVEASDPRTSLPRDVWVMNADGSERKRLVGGDDPNWSPDGARIIHPTGGQSGMPALGVVERDGVNARILFPVRACRPLQSSWFGPSS